jgi:hypothetical protein
VAGIKTQIKMKNLENIEVFNIQTTEEGSFAWISYRDLDDTDNLNNGNFCKRVPLNLRPIQLSSRDNVLTDQSVKNYVDVAHTAD